MFFPPPHDRLAELEASHAGQLHITPRPGNYYMALGTATPPFDDLRVRRALNLAVDRAAIGRLFGTTGQIDVPDPAAELPGLRPLLPLPGTRSRRGRGSSWRRRAPRARG